MNDQQQHANKDKNTREDAPATLSESSKEDEKRASITRQEEEHDGESEGVISPNQGFHHALEKSFGEAALSKLSAQIGRQLAEEAVARSGRGVAEAILADWKEDFTWDRTVDTTASLGVAAASEPVERDWSDGSQLSSYTWPKDGIGWDNCQKNNLPNLSEELPSMGGLQTDEVSMSSAGTMDTTSALLGKRKKECDASTEDDDPTPQMRRQSRKSKSRHIDTDEESTLSRRLTRSNAVTLQDSPSSKTRMDSDQPTASGSESEKGARIRKPSPPRKATRRRRNADEPTIEQRLRPLHTTEELTIMPISQAGVAVVEWLEDIDTVRIG